MKIRFCSLAVSLLVVSQARASLPITVLPNVPEMSVKELLSMPEKNRNILAQGKAKDENFLTELQSIAFNKNDDFNNRWKALTLYSQIKGPEAESVVLRACGQDEWFMKNACLVILKTTNPNLSKEKAKEFLKSKALVVRSQAVRNLASDLDTSTRELLWEELDRPVNFRLKQSLWIRSEIVEALSARPLKQELGQFAKALRDRDSRIHISAIRALEAISGEKKGSLKSSIADQRELWLKELK